MKAPSPSFIVSEVLRHVKGLTDPRFRIQGDAGYFLATRAGRTLSVLVDHIDVRTEAVIVQLIVSELGGTA